MTKVDTYTRMYEPPEWFDPEEAVNLHAWYPELGSLMTTFEVAGTLGVIERRGKIPAGQLEVFEFGSGFGEGLVSLNMFAQARPESRVVGSEIIETVRRTAVVVSGLLERVVAVVPDGITELKNRTAKADVILAHLFGPSYRDEALPSIFIPAALSALKPGGAVIINSDSDTMKNVTNWAEGNLNADQIDSISPEQLPSGYIAMPHLVLTTV